MNKNFTEKVNNSNVRTIQEQISMKLGYNPFYATEEQAGSVLTDFDTFPYPRWYRGVYNSETPGVIEREAGWRMREDNCYTLNLEPENPHDPNHCFQAPCSVVYPCYSQTIGKKKRGRIMLNDYCVPMYR